MFNVFRKFLLAFVVLVLALMPATSIYVMAREARTISIFRIDGNNVTLARNHLGRASTPRAGQRLSEGNVLTTGRNTTVHIQMDDASILKMAESSSIQVGATRNLLSLTVQSGTALVDVTRQTAGNALETRVGNVGLTVRGTTFFIGRRDTDVTTINMLSGSGVVVALAGTGQVAEIPLGPGFTMRLRNVNGGADLQDVLEQSITIHPLNLNDLGLFELEEILNMQDYLLDIGTIVPSDIETAERLVEVRRRERDARLDDEPGGRESGRVVLPTSTPTPTPPPEREPDEPVSQGGFITIGGERIPVNSTEVCLVGRGLSDSDIVPLSQLTNVRYLHLDGNLISDLSPLAGLGSLVLLGLSSNSLSDESLSIFSLQYSGLAQPIQPFPHLSRLYLDSNEITNIEQLANLTGLKYLTLHFNDISDVGPLANMLHLERLWLFGNNISDIGPLANLTNLNDLDLRSNQISDLTPLSNMIHLRSLLLVDNNIISLGPLSGLTNLLVLSLAANDITDISPLESLLNLEILSLIDNSITDISSLYNLRELSYVFLEGNTAISDWSPVYHVPFVDVLHSSGRSFMASFFWLPECDCGCVECNGECYCDEEYPYTELPYPKEDENKYDDEEITAKEEEDKEEEYFDETDEDTNYDKYNGEDYYKKENDEEYLPEPDDDDDDDEGYKPEESKPDPKDYDTYPPEDDDYPYPTFPEDGLYWI